MEVDLIALAAQCPDLTISVKLSDLAAAARLLKDDILAGVARENAKASNAISEELLTREDTMKYLGVSAPTLWRWKKSGYLVPVQFGSMDRYRRSDLNKIINQKGIIL